MIRTQEHKDKISATLKERFKDKTNHPMWGTKFSIETRTKQREAKKDIYWGENNPNYRGGITPLRVSIYKCGKTKCYLEVHHRKSFALILEENNIKSLQDAYDCKELWDIGNGKALCEDCHKKTDTYGVNLRKQVIPSSE